MEHRLKDIKYDVQKHIAPQAICYNTPLICDKWLGALAYCETCLLGVSYGVSQHSMYFVKKKNQLNQLL